MAPFCFVYRLGLLPYQQAWQLQDELAGQVAAGAHPPALLLLEHPHVYTFGRRGQAENLLWDEAELARRGVEVAWVDRGGDVTYHGPGQLVGYPLLPLGPIGMERLPQVDYDGYLRRLEETLILALMRLGLSGRQLDGLTGVWVQPDAISRGRNCASDSTGVSDRHQPPAKIAAIGVKVDARGVTRHGFALNVDPDMTYWQGIIGCGLKDYPVTSLAELLQPVPRMETVANKVITAFSEVFGYETKIKT